MKGSIIQNQAGLRKRKAKQIAVEAKNIPHKTAFGIFLVSISVIAS